MQVDLIARTMVLPAAMQRHGFTPDAASIDSLAEFAGRACYQSFHRPNPKTATNRAYLAHIIDSGHFSVLEHGSVTFYITGVSRALTHELVRHRHLSYSQVSQRYVDEEKGETVLPPAYAGERHARDMVSDVHDFAKVMYAELVQMGEGMLDLPRKQARQAARAVLPNATETKIVVTGNLRAWRDFLSKRWHVAADAEIEQLAGLILDELRNVAPAAVQDVPTAPYGDGPTALTRDQAEEALLEHGVGQAAVMDVLDAMFPTAVAA